MLARRAARRYMPPAWDWRLLVALIRQESNFRPTALSPKGAVGLCQLLPSTGREFGLSPEALWDPEANIDAGARYMRQLWDMWDDVADRAPMLRTRLALAAYNAGPKRVKLAWRLARRDCANWQAVRRHLPAETVQHVERIVDHFYPLYRRRPLRIASPRVALSGH